MTTTDDRWPRFDRAGDAQSLHDLDLPPQRGVWVLAVDGPSLVLGSTQPLGVLDRDRVASTDVAVARRRSGGGLVGLVPGGALWVDVVIPSGDELWLDDVGRSFLWLGERWRDALGELGLSATVVEAPRPDRPWSDLVCFAGHSTGEVVLGDAKVVGLSQRRTREMARFQCLALIDPSLELLVDHLDLTASQRHRLRADARHMTAAAPAGIEAVLEAFLARLP